MCDKQQKKRVYSCQKKASSSFRSLRHGKASKSVLCIVAVITLLLFLPTVPSKAKPKCTLVCVCERVCLRHTRRKWWPYKTWHFSFLLVASLCILPSFLGPLASSSITLLHNCREQNSFIISSSPQSTQPSFLSHIHSLHSTLQPPKKSSFLLLYSWQNLAQAGAPSPPSLSRDSSLLSIPNRCLLFL